MSAGAVFKLIANDGKADRMIMATKLLNQRIKDVMCARSSAGKADVTPTLVDLERTHILYVNAHFKPFAAIGYEYNKVRPQSGNPTLGGGVTFSIPQFGDFFHDMVCRTRLSAIEASSGTTPVQGTAAFPAATLAIGISTFHNIVGADGTLLVRGVAVGAQPAATGITYQNLVRYCEYPGNRLFESVKFDVNGNPLDQYDFMVPTMLEKFCIMPGKRAGYDRLVGQEVALTGYGGLRMGVVTDADTANTPKGITKFQPNQSNQTVGLFGQTAASAGTGANGIAATNMDNVTLNATTAGGQFDISRQLQTFVNGPQTPKPIQAPLEIWNKLRFWFNDDVRLSIASVSIPFGQRYITIELTQQSNLVFEFPSIYLETIVDPLDQGTTFNAVNPGAIAAGATNSRVYSYSPIFIQNGISSSISIEKMELYINNIFVNPEVHDIYIKRIGFSLIRVYREQISRCNAGGADERLLSQLKWPVEYMFVGLRPVWNIKAITGSSGQVVNAASFNQNMWRDWHRLTRLVDVNAAGFTSEQSVLPTGVFGAGGGSNIGQIMPDQYWLPVSTVDQMSLTSHGIVIFDGFSDTFFNQYLPFHYGGTALNTPDDPGALFINMALFPRSYQPSGHLNISRARETYLQWTSSYISSSTPADLYVVAVAINFLLITDGSAVLRYST